MEQSAGWSYTKQDAHIYDRSKKLRSNPRITLGQSADRSRGEGRGGVHHMEAKVSAKNEENVFACAFSTSCMSGRDLSDKLTFPFIFLVFW